jgi:capsular polysaccharide transport system permease protein
MTKFNELDLQRKVAEDLYGAAAAALEVARLNAEDKLLYLKTFVAPAVPEEAQYPMRLLNTSLVLGGSLLLWGLICALAATFRDHMA